MIITTQPENYFGSVGGTATFTVAAEGDRITYQWQRSINDGETWDNISGGTSTTLSVPIQASLNGYLYRCIAKDFMGHIATSQAGKLTVASGTSAISEFDPEYTVINEPDDYYGRPGDIATFIVEAEGANLSYQWLCRAPGANNFEYLTSSDATTNTLRVEMTAASNGAEYRCFITDANGDMGSTRIATIKLDILDWEMEYNTSGIRTKRVSEDKTYSYIYAGDKLMQMTVGNDTLDFSYDTNGVPLTMTYNGTVYYYITNLQGDVMKLERADGGSGAQYAYDAWGNIIAMSGTLAELNPLRYRGYVYDQETGFYYLQSRYYDPAIGRFLNADSYASTGQGIIGSNMLAYCSNNPVNSCDTTGKLAVASYSIGTAIDFLLDVTINQLVRVTASAMNQLVEEAKIAYARTSKAIRSYAKACIDEYVELLKKSLPCVHHIVPPGEFSNRADRTQQHLQEMREILIDAGINPEKDWINQVSVSQGFHASLHTNLYIEYLYKDLKKASGDKDQVKLVLYWYRIMITAADPYSAGY